MAKGEGHQREKLKAITVERLVKAGEPGKVCDGGGLWLVVQSKTAASWVYRYHMAGVDRQAGVGKYPDIGLADARSIAADMRTLKAKRLDPIEERRRQSGKTFKACAEEYITSKAPGWRNEKTEVKWRAVLRDHAFPIFGHLSVAAVDTPLVLRAITQVWTTRPTTGRDLREFIERVLDWATAHGYRAGDNPATMKLLRNLLPAQTHIVEHHDALPFAETPDFIRALRARPAMAARALEFTILTAVRTGETIGAKWGEMDLEAKIWIIPAKRMKSPREHRVPLSDRAVEILAAIKPDHVTRDTFVFPGGKADRPLSNMAMLMLLRRMKRDDGLTVHGFRSTFRDWCAENGIDHDVAEAALAHAVKNKVEAAYRRTTFFEHRRRAMQAWADACSAVQVAGANIVALHASAVA
jgi:integrase